MSVKKGDFVEATVMGKECGKRQGLVTDIYPDGTVLVELGSVLVLCQNPKKISESNLNRAQRYWVMNRRASLDPVDLIKRYRAEKPTPSFGV